MKFKMIALFLALSLVTWAQTATPNPPSGQDTPKGGCTDCCKHMAGDKDKGAHGCFHDMHASGDTKDAACCGGKDEKGCMGKDAKACMKGDSANASCAGGKCCDMKDGKGCCLKSAEGDETAMACCSGTHCDREHAHAGMSN